VDKTDKPFSGLDLRHSNQGSHPGAFTGQKHNPLILDFNETLASLKSQKVSVYFYLL
jgi:hypothetical protein